MAVRSLQLQEMPCQPRQVTKLYKRRVFFPAKLTFSERLKRKGLEPFEVTHTHQVDAKSLSVEIERLGTQVYKGKVLYHGMLRVSRKSTPAKIILEQNPGFHLLPRQELSLSPPHIQSGGVAAAKKPEGAVVKELREYEEAKDIQGIVNILAEDNPRAVRAKIQAGKIGEVIAKQSEATKKRILMGICDGLLKAHTALFNRQDLNAFSFLQTEDQLEILEKVRKKREEGGKKTGFLFACFRSLERRLESLGPVFRKEISDQIERRAQGLEGSLFVTRQAIEHVTGCTLEEIRAGKAKISTDKLNKALAEAAKIGSLLPPATTEYLVKEISESRRAELVEFIEQSDLEESRKRPLLYVLAEEKFVCLSMFSFTDPLLAGALLATAMRGAKVRVLLDRREAGRSTTVYEEVVASMGKFCREHGIEESDPPLQIRMYPALSDKGGTFSSLHFKGLVLGSGAYQIGSQNWSHRGFYTNVEGVLSSTASDDVFGQLIAAFDQLWDYLGNMVPFPAKVAEQPWITRACFKGIVFEDASGPEDMGKVFRLFGGIRDAAVSGVLKAMAIARGMGAEVVVDVENKAFNAFRAEIGNRVIADTILPRFLKDSPAEFFVAAASRGGAYHPGYTIRVGGLKEHSEMVAEIVLQLCKMLGIKGRERDKAVLATLLHDTWKNAFVKEEGEVRWGFYNREHGPLAAQKLREIYEALSPEQKKQFTPQDLEDVCNAIGGHMTIFDSKNPRPLSPQDSPLRFVVAIADMIASRKYMYIENRASLPMDRKEALDRMINNPFSVEGVGWAQLKKQRTLFDFIITGLKLSRNYDNLKPRTKKLLRVAESLCKQFELAQQKPPKKETAEERDQRIAANKKKTAIRAEIFAAAVIFGETRFRRGLNDDPEIESKNQTSFTRRMHKLRLEAKRRGMRINNALDLVEEMNACLETPHKIKEGGLTPQDKPALWILLMSYAVLASEKLHVVTNTEVNKHLADAQQPHTVWRPHRFKEEEVAKMARGLETLLLTAYREEFIPQVEQMLLGWINRNRRNKVTSIPREAINALIDRFGSVFPRLLYEKFYQPMSSHFRTKFVGDLIECSHEEPEKAQAALERVLRQIGPATRRPQEPAAVFGLMARTFMANGVKTLGAAKKILSDTRNRGRLKQYGYFKGIALSDKKRLGGIRKGAEHIVAALKKGEKICIYGDYDVDGEFATAMLVESFRTVRARFLVEKEGLNKKQAWEQAVKEITFHIPHRQHEGYGMNLEFIRKCARQGISHVVSVDCGIRDKELVRQGTEMGISFIITDHHDPVRRKNGQIDLKALPEAAVAVVNPKVQLAQGHSAYNLSGAGAAYKLTCAVVDGANRELNTKNQLDLGYRYQDLVAATVITDVCPLLGENRAFVHYGLDLLERAAEEERLIEAEEIQARSPETVEANSALVYIANQMGLETIDEQAIGFWLGPLFNATGRVGHAHTGTNLILARRREEIQDRYERALPDLYARKQTEDAILDDAKEQLKNPRVYNPEKDRGIALVGDYHRGVMGIVASRLVESEGVPVVIMGRPFERRFSETPDEVYGSMRSTDGISAIQILDQCNWQYEQEKGAPLFERYGGHFGAAGFKLKESRTAEFRRIYKEVSRKIVGDKKQAIRYVGNFKEGDFSLGRVVFLKRLLGPFGNGFRQPLFRTRVTIPNWEVFGPDGNHVKGVMGKKRLDFVKFKGNTRATKRILLRRRAQMVGSWNVHRWRGRRKLQFLAEDIKFVRWHHPQKRAV